MRKELQPSMTRRLVQLPRYAAQELHHEKDEEGIAGEQGRHHEGQVAVQPAEVAEQKELRDDRTALGSIRVDSMTMNSTLRIGKSKRAKP